MLETRVHEDGLSFLMILILIVNQELIFAALLSLQFADIFHSGVSAACAPLSAIMYYCAEVQVGPGPGEINAVK